MQGKASYGGYVTWDDHPARVAAAHKVHIFSVFPEHPFIGSSQE
jgi:hypothetical protein